MKTKIWLMMVLATSLIASCDQPAEPTAQGIKEYMAETVQPTAERYWDSVQYISDESGSHEIVPTTDAEWEATRQAAADLGSIGQTLMGDYSTERSADWNQFAQGLIDISKQAEQAARDKDVDAVFEVGGTIYNVCTACHQSFPPAEDEVSADQEGSV